MCKKFVLAGFAAGLVMLVLGFAASSLFQFLFSYDVLSLPGMRSVDDPVMSLYFLYPFVLAFAMAYLYVFAGAAINGDLLGKGIKLGCLFWAVFGIPSSFIVFSTMVYPLGFTLYSLFGSFAVYVFGGVVLVKVLEVAGTKPKKKK